MDWILHNEAGQLLLLILALVVARFVSKHYLKIIIRRAVRSHKFESVAAEVRREDTLIHIVSILSYIVIWALGILGFLTIIHVNLLGLMTGAGALSLLVLFGGQNVIKDFVAGFSILIENQYRVGDVITLGTSSGVVESMTLRLTQLRDLDGNLHIVPNGTITSVINSTIGWSNVNLDIAVRYEADVEEVKKVINETGSAMAKDEGWSAFITEPIAFLRVNEFGDSSVIIKCLGKVAPGKQWAVAGEFRRRIKLAFEKNKIAIPYPQRVIHQPK